MTAKKKNDINYCDPKCNMKVFCILYLYVTLVTKR